VEAVVFTDALSPLRADLLLVHPPAFFEFRNREDIYFPFLGTSGDVPITPLYEYFPVGFKTLQRYLGDRGHDVRILNLSTLFLKYPTLSLAAILNALDVRILGLDLHWMVHVQGSLAVAEQVRASRPEIPIIFGGISATYYADELIRYPFIDLVLRGYDTHEPLSQLLDRLKRSEPLSGVPNLLWKDHEGQVVDNGFDYQPDSFGCGIDWSTAPREVASPNGIAIREFLSTQNAGCANNCGWCGGSRDAFRRIFQKKRAMARRPRDEVRYEISTLQRIPNLDQYHFYAVGSYNETPSSFLQFLELIQDTPLKSISYEQFHLPPDDLLTRMARANRRTSITLSPESHDPVVAKLAGRGVYTNQQMEDWIERALDRGIYGIDVWYFIGMPEQDEASVMGTVEYCEKLLTRFQNRRVHPMICPMIPFLDPASNFFENPGAHGYRVFYRSVEQHRRGMERASLINRINYETRWLSRADLVSVGFRAVRRLMEAKAGVGMLPPSVVKSYNAKIDDALAFAPEVHRVDCLPDARERARQLANLGSEIRRRNDLIFFSGVANQAFPVYRKVGLRWFDEQGWPTAELDAATGAPAAVALAR
jgi:clorobiocin biosynthesis protein CloN6